MAAVDVASSRPDHSIVNPDPGDAHDDHREKNGAGNPEVLNAYRRIESRQDRANLQSDEHKGQHVEHEDGRLPDRVRRNAHAGRCDLGRRACHRQREADHGENAGEAYSLRDDPHPKRVEELNDDRGRNVADIRRQSNDQPGRDYPEHDAADHSRQKRGGHGPDRKCVGRQGADRQAIDQQCACVVQQALAFEDRQDAARWFDVAQHRGRRGRIGRRHDGPESNCRGPRHGRNKGARDDGHRRRCHRDAKDDQIDERYPVVPQVARRRVERGIQ